MSDGFAALLLVFSAPVVLGGLFWLIMVLEGGTGDEPPSPTPFDPPPWR